MKELDPRRDTSMALCGVCGLAKQRGHPTAPDLVREALEIARDEIGALPELSECPMGSTDHDGCPLVPKPRC